MILSKTILQKLISKENISTVSFNTANGNDVIIGLDQVANRFVIYNGRKIFIGGNKNNIFYFYSQ